MPLGCTHLDAATFTRWTHISRLQEAVGSQFDSPEAAHICLDQEVRARPGDAALRVKFRSARWFPDAASRLQHRQAAWDMARAALRNDIGYYFCADSPRFVDWAWREAGMPARGQPLTVRHVLHLSRLSDYLNGYMWPEPCRGGVAEYRRAAKRLEVALATYRRLERQQDIEYVQEAPCQHSVRALACMRLAIDHVTERPDMSVTTAVAQSLAEVAQDEARRQVAEARGEAAALVASDFRTQGAFLVDGDLDLRG